MGLFLMQNTDFTGEDEPVVDTREKGELYRARKRNGDKDRNAAHEYVAAKPIQSS